MSATPPQWPGMNENDKLDYLKYQVEQLWKVLTPLSVGHQNLSSHLELTSRTLQEVATALEKVEERVEVVEVRTRQ